MKAAESTICPVCREPVDRLLYRYHLEGEQRIIAQIREQHPGWKESDGACGRCVDYYHTEIVLRQRILPETGPHFPVRTADDYIVLPTPLRVDANPSYTGKGVTICFIDSGFFPHPDLIAHQQRILAYVDIPKGEFHPSPPPVSDDPAAWHGTMTTVVCAGDGYLSNGLYRGIASGASLVLMRVQDQNGRISTQHIVGALQWVIANHQQYGIRIINMSIGDDEAIPASRSEINRQIGILEKLGLVVVAAAGNDSSAPIKPPANSPAAITVGGLDDGNAPDLSAAQLYHSSFGEIAEGLQKPELIAPAIWIAAPLLPGSKAQQAAAALFQELSAVPEDDPRHSKLVRMLHQDKLISPHYKHVDGTSFAAPVVCAVIAQLLELDPSLQPGTIRQLLFASAKRLPGYPANRQGYGLLRPRKSVLQLIRHEITEIPDQSPLISADENRIRFFLYRPCASSVSLAGSFNDWSPEVLFLEPGKNGTWKIDIPRLPAGKYRYKYFVDEKDWVEDLHNPLREPDGFEGFNSLLTIKNQVCSS